MSPNATRDTRRLSRLLPQSYAFDRTAHPTRLKLRIVTQRVRRSEENRARVSLKVTSEPLSKTAEVNPAMSSGDGVASAPAFRRARARLAARAWLAKRPELAREAGRKGGLSTSRPCHLGEKAWATAMSLRRWHKSPFNYASRAPKAGSGAETDGTVKPDPATALPPDTNAGEKT